ncbi:MAG: hypothetical protein ABFC78_05680 [Methanoregula sp.]
MSEDTIPPESKEVRVLKAKIKTRKDQAADISFTGPAILIVLGVLICLFLLLNLWAFIIGLILIGIGIVWWNSRSSEEKRLKNEIRELEVELEA